MSDTKLILDKLDKLDARHEKLDERLHSVDKRLETYNKELEFHVARTNQLEDLVMPVHAWYQQWQGVGAAIVWISVVAGIIGALAWLWQR